MISPRKSTSYHHHVQRRLPRHSQCRVPHQRHRRIQPQEALQRPANHARRTCQLPVSPSYSPPIPLLLPAAATNHPTQQHKPGVQASPADHAPEFSAQTLPPGTAPAKDTFTPNPSGADAIPGQADNPNLSATSGGDSGTGALDMPGATSGDVHTGLGHPGSGQTSNEVRHHGGGAGLEGVGGRGPPGVDREFARLGEERGFDEEGPKSARTNETSLPGAENVPNVSAEQLASREGNRS